MESSPGNTCSLSPNGSCRKLTCLVLNYRHIPSTDLPNGNLNFEWTQTGGPSLGTGNNQLTNPTTPSPTFVAPQTSTTYTFTLKVCVKDASGASISTQCSTDTVTINI